MEIGFSAVMYVLMPNGQTLMEGVYRRQVFEKGFVQ